MENSNAFGISHFLCGFKVIPQIPIQLNVTPMKAPLRAVSDACDLFFLFNVIFLIGCRLFDLLICFCCPVSTRVQFAPLLIP